MHAYLLVGQEITNYKKAGSSNAQITNLAAKLHAKIMEFPLIKIDDVRSLNNLTRLSFNEPTLIVCQDIHKAGEEALNAFLKNLEEPQENIYFVLTTPSIQKVLPTIVSRCQVIRTVNSQQSTVISDETQEFTASSVGKKLEFVDKIKDRDKAIEFAESLVYFYHDGIHSDNRQEVGPLDTLAKNAQIAGNSINNLKANGNVSLQLTNLVIGLL